MLGWLFVRWCGEGIGRRGEERYAVEQEVELPF